MREFALLVAALYLAFCVACARLLARRAGSLRQGALSLAVCLVLPGAGPLLLWFWECRAGRREKPDYHEFCRGAVFCPDDLLRMQSPDCAPKPTVSPWRRRFRYRTGSTAAGR